MVESKVDTGCRRVRLPIVLLRQHAYDARAREDRAPSTALIDRARRGTSPRGRASPWARARSLSVAYARRCAMA
eukprot:6200667-Pleurochrysis_carterae.AAC.1